MNRQHGRRLLAAALLGGGLVVGAAAPALAAPAPVAPAQDDGAMPRGGIETGFGGTAEDTDGSALTWTVAGATVLAVASGAMLVRSRRGEERG
ncbi:hypothetical protein ABZ639_00315 [Saccharomonospora sp. NPDC006951]